MSPATSAWSRRPSRTHRLCFVTDTIAGDLERRLAGRFRPGALLDTDGNTIGEHRGVPFYTVGQRSGIDVAPTRPDTAPRYVVAVDAGNNTITVGPRSALERTAVTLDDVHWIDVAPRPGEALTLQLRSHAAPAPVTVAATQPGAVLLTCDPAVTQVAPGQAGVLYDGDEVVGGGLVAS